MRHIPIVLTGPTLLFAVMAMMADPVATRAEHDARDTTAAWTGCWRTNWGVMTLELTEKGQFAGVYGPAKHTVVGAIDPDNPRVLSGTWRHTGSEATGRFRFELSPGGGFYGGWTSGQADPADNHNVWIGVR